VDNFRLADDPEVKYLVEALRPALRQRSNVTVMRVKAVVDMAEKAARAMKPGASSKKHPVNKPIGPLVAVRSTVIWGIVEVPISQPIYFP